MAHLNYTVGGDSNLVSFKSAARVPIDSLKVHFKPMQEGTGDPSPENVRPITGWTGVDAYKTGKNLAVKPSQLSRRLGANMFVDHDGFELTSSGLKGTPATRSTGVQYLFGFVEAGKQYTFSYNITGTCTRTYIYILSINSVTSKIDYREAMVQDIGWKTNHSPYTFVVNHSGYLWVVFDQNQDVQTEFEISNIQLELGSTATAYEPYTGLTIPVEFHGKNLLNANAPEQAPSDISGASSAKRIFAKNTRWPGIAYSNYYIAAYVTEYSVSNGVLSVTNNNVYGVGYALKLVPGQQYILSATSADGRADYAFYAEDGTWLSAVQNKLGSPVTIPDGTDTTVVIFYSPTSGTNVTFSNIQLELGSTATAYEPYNNMFYGGYVDIANGELVQEWVTVTYDGVTTDRKVNSDYSNSTDIIGGIVYCKPAGLSDDSLLVTRNYCDTMPIVGTNVASPTYPFVRTIMGGALYLRIYIAAAADHPELDTNQKRIDYVNSYLIEHPMSVSYKLATPITYQLTPTELSTLLSTNNIWSNANDVTEVSYAVHDSAMIRAAKRRMAACWPKNYLDTAWTHYAYINGSGTYRPDTSDASSRMTNAIVMKAGTYRLKGTNTSPKETLTYRIHEYNASDAWVRQVAYFPISEVGVVDETFTLDHDSNIRISMAIKYFIGRLIKSPPPLSN